MIKREVFGIFLILLLILIPFISSEVCNPKPILLSQDPYPAVPGESVKLVFQIDGLTNTNCKDVKIKILESYPFSINPSSSKIVGISSGIFLKDFASFALVPFKLDVDKNVLKGEHKLELQISFDSTNLLFPFDIEVSDLRTDFEITVKNYDKNTNTFTFEILNVGKNDVDALTIDVPKQDSFSVIGSSRYIIGSLDSNDDTTFIFRGISNNKQINLIVTYTDKIDERRILEEMVYFDEEYFDKVNDSNGMSVWFYITLILVIGIIIFWYMNRTSKKRRRERPNF